ncbi:hypothetical protein ANAPC5_01247 [Anaplasma phagocytophilum]|nr:hypothetical protein ANAPC5_01247 [Anaplasma phagocytophilum]
MPYRDLIRNQAGYTEVCPHLSRMSEVKATRRSPTKIYATNRKPLSLADCCLRPVMGSFPHNTYSNQYLPVVTDHFTKLVELFPLQKLLSQKNLGLPSRRPYQIRRSCRAHGGSYFQSKVVSTSVLCLAYSTSSLLHSVYSLLCRLAVRWQMHHMHSDREHKSSIIYYWFPRETNTRRVHLRV